MSKQQVSALMHGEDLPEGALARETAEVSYQLPAVARGATNCPVCKRKFITHHCLMKHMGVHCMARSSLATGVARSWPPGRC